MVYNYTRLDGGRLTLHLRDDQHRGYRASALDRDDYGGRILTRQCRARYWGVDHKEADYTNAIHQRY